MTKHFQIVQQIDLQRQVNKFYKKYKQNVSVNLSDFSICCVAEDEVIAAAFVRSLKHQDIHFHVLRSVFVAPLFRRQGVAKHLCQQLLHCQKSIHLCCEAHLVPMYQGLGLKICDETNLPDILRNEQKKGLTLMVRPFHSQKHV